MRDIAQPLCRALRACAAKRRAVLIPQDRRAALRAKTRHYERHRPVRPLGLVDRKYLRDDLPRLLQQHRVPDAQIQPVDVVLIVQRRCGHRGPRQTHRLHDHLGGQDAGPADLNHHVKHAALLLLRRILEGHSPARRLGRAAEGRTLCQGVDLDDRPVHIIGQLLPVLAQPFDPLHTVPDRLIAPIGHHREAHGLHGVQRLGMAGKAAVGAVLQIKADDVQLARSRDLRIQLPHGAGGRVAGIGQQRFPAQLPLLVQLAEHRLGHIDLAPDDQALRRVFDPQRQRTHRAQILRHVFAHQSVAACRTADKDAVFVFERHGQPVDLWLHRIAVRLRDRSVHTLAEGVELIQREDIRQALQRHLMAHLLKLAQGRAADPLGRGIGRDQLRVLGLDGFEPLHQHVIFIVGDHRRIIDMVHLVMIFQLPTQFVQFLLYLHDALPLLHV